MATRTISKCPVCGYPIKSASEGEAVVCAYCGSELIAQGVTIPTPVFVGVIALLAGIFLGPAIIASSATGRSWLEKKARGG